MKVEQSSQTRTISGGADIQGARGVLAYTAPTEVARNDLAMTPVHLRSLLRAAVLDLGSLFADEHARVNSLLAQQGSAERITIAQQGIERRYALGAGADVPHVSLFVCVPAADGHVFGGAFVTTSKTSPYIYLMPQIEGARVLWTVTATHTPFNRATARDLFSAAFSNDEDATTRISRLVGFDLFQMPWS